MIGLENGKDVGAMTLIKRRRRFVATLIELIHEVCAAEGTFGAGSTTIPSAGEAFCLGQGVIDAAGEAVIEAALQLDEQGVVPGGVGGGVEGDGPQVGVRTSRINAGGGTGGKRHGKGGTAWQFKGAREQRGGKIAVNQGGQAVTVRVNETRRDGGGGRKFAGNAGVVFLNSRTRKIRCELESGDGAFGGSRKRKQDVGVGRGKSLAGL